MTPQLFVYSPLKKNKNPPLTTCRMPSSLFSLLLPIQSSNKGACVCTCTQVCCSICHLIWVFLGCTSVILTCRLASVPALHVSDCPGADAKHIIVNPLICLVHTNALIWRGVPSTVACDHKVISVQYIKREFLQWLATWCVCMHNHVISEPQVHTFRGPHWCEYCANFMWGLIAQGVRCSGNYTLQHQSYMSCITQGMSHKSWTTRVVYDLWLTLSCHGCFSCIILLSVIH